MAGPQAQRPISHSEGASALRELRPMSQDGTGDGVGGRSGGGGAAIHSDGNVEQHIEITIDSDQNRDKDVEHGGKKVRHRHHHRRPLYRRVINYLRHAWTGVKFSSSNGNDRLLFLNRICIFVVISFRFDWQRATDNAIHPIHIN